MATVKLTKTRVELYAEAKQKIAQARSMLDAMTGGGLIAPMPV